MSRKEELVAKLKEAPTNKSALDNLVAFFVQRGDFQALYGGLQDVVEGIEDRGILAEFRAILVEIVKRHLDHATDPVMAANLKLRLAGLLFDRSTQSKEALILVTEAFERLPSDEIAQRAVHMLREMSLSRFVVLLLKRKAAAEVGSERRADTLFQLGHAALVSGHVSLAKKAFEELRDEYKGWAEKAQEGLSQTEAAIQEANEAVTELEAKVAKANDVERPLFQTQLGRKLIDLGRSDDGIDLLERVMKESPSDAACMELVAAYKEQESWSALVDLVDEWSHEVGDDETQRELLKERARVFTLKLGNKKAGYAALEDLYKRYPGNADVVEFCVHVYSECDDHDALAELLGNARQDTKDRDQERRYLEWEAALKWRKLGDLEAAEKLYRRIKSIDPRNEPALLFYEDYSREKGDFRKLYSILSTRQSLAPESQKARILKQMAELAREQLDSPDRAIDALKKVLALDANDDDAFAQLAELLESTRRWHAVIEHYSSKVDRLPDHAVERKLELLERIREIYSSKDKQPVPEMVVTTFRRMLQIDPTHSDSIEALGEYYRKNNRWGELTEVLERKVELESDPLARAALHKEIAHILVEFQHKEAAALPHLERVVEMEPDDDEAIALLAKAYRGRGEHEKFFTVGQRLLDRVMGRERVELLEELATIAMERLGLDDDAIALLEQLFEAEPRHPWALRRLRQLYEKLERFDELAEVIARAMPLAPAAKQRSLKEKLGVVLSDKLHRYQEAKALFAELLEENPGNRQARQYLQRIYAQAGEFAELEAIYVKDKNLPGLMRFLDDFRKQESEAERALAAGLEMVRIAQELLNDKPKALQTLEALLEQFPTDAGLARRLLDSYPASRNDLDVAKALAVIADNTEGDEAHEAALRLGDVLEKNGEHEAAYTRTLGLFLRTAREGDFALLERVADRAESSGSMDGFTRVLESLLEEDFTPDAREELLLHLVAIHLVRRKDTNAARALLEAELTRTPDSLAILRELERIHMGAGNWADLEVVVRSMADQVLDLDDKKTELHKLARLYDEIVGDAGKAAAVFQELRELDPTDEEAYAGLKRSLEELEDWPELALALEDEILVANEEQTLENLLQLATIQREHLDSTEDAALTLRRLLELSPDHSDAWAAVDSLFQSDEALATVLPLLEARHRAAQAWEPLVATLAKQAQLEEDDETRFEILGQCAAILEDELGQPDEAFSYLAVMVSMNPSHNGLLTRLESVGRLADKSAERYAIYKGLLEIGESDFVPQTSLDEAREQEVALLLASLAEEHGESGIAVAAIQRARMVAPGDLDLFERLEGLYEAGQMYEELLALLEEKKEYVWDEQEKIGLLARAANLLTSELGRELEAIPWFEELFALTGQSPHISTRLEELYLKYEQWPELSQLLRVKLARLEGEERTAVAYQLAIILRDHLADLQGCFDLLSEVLVTEPENLTYLEALSFLLTMTRAEDYQDVVLKVVDVVEPLARQQEDFERLAQVLEVKASHAPEEKAEATAWLELGRTLQDHLGAPEKALWAFGEAVRAQPSNHDALDALLAVQSDATDPSGIIAALDRAIGDLETTHELGALTAFAALLVRVGEDPQRAAQAYERLLELAPEELSHYQALEQLYAALDDATGRIRVLGEMAERLEGPRMAEVKVELAQLLLANDHRDDAVDALYRALEMPDLLDDDRRPLAFHLLEEALESDNRWFDLVEVLGRRIGHARDLDEQRALRYRAAHIEEEQLDNPDNAVLQYFAILDLEPTDEAATSALFRLLESTGRFSDLEELLATQVELAETPERAQELLLGLARVRLTELGNTDRAVDALGRLVEGGYYQDTALALLEEIVEEASDAGYRASQLLEVAYVETAQHERLAGIYKSQIDRFASEVDRVERFRALATLYEKQFSDIDTAFAYISQAFKLEPSSQAIHEQLISYAKERAGFDELFDIYLDVLVQLDDPEGRNNLRKKMVEIYHDELQDTDHAEMIYRDMLDDEADNDFALTRLQDLYRAQEKWDALIDVLRSRVDTARSDKSRIATLYEIASLYRENTQDLAQALDTYEEILAIDATQSDAYRGIESVYFERSDVHSVTATLRRELDVREDAEERKEVRLRLAAIHFTELEEHDQSVAELALVLSDSPLDEAALELLAEVVAAWDSPSQEAVELLVDAHTERKEWDALIALYQSLAARAVSEDERIAWFSRIYEIRTDRQGDEVGAFAAAKIMCALQPDAALHRTRLLEHAESIGQVDDLLDFFTGILEHDRVAGTEQEGEFQLILARLHKDREGDAAVSCHYYELVQEGPRPEYVQEARLNLRELYQELESWEKYVLLLETMAAESNDPVIRKNFVLEAALVAWRTMADETRAFEILSQAATEFSDDAMVLDRYEQLLSESGRVEELEELLRNRADITMDPAARGEVRLRLGNLLLNQEGSISLGIDELLTALDEAPEKAVTWTILETLLASDETPHEDRLRIAQTLEEKYPDSVPSDQLMNTLEAHLMLVEGGEEANGLHLRLAHLLEEVDTEQALAHFAQSMRLFPGVREVEEKVALLSRSLEAWSDFRDLLQEVAQLTDDDSQAVRYLLAAAQLEEDELGSPDAAATIRERVLELDEYNRMALAALASYYQGQEAHEDTARILTQQIALEDDASLRVANTARLARLYSEQLADLPQARHWWEELLHEPEARPEACSRLEDIYRQQEEWELLCDLLLEVREEVEDPDELQMVMVKLAGLYEQYLERTEEAFHWYRELLSLSPDFAPALHGARRCATELEDWQTVADIDEQLIAAAEDDDEAAILRQELAFLYIDQLDNKPAGLACLQVLLALEEVPDEVKELAMSQVDDPEIGFAASLALEPLLEAAGDWTRLIQLSHAQMETLDTVDEKLPIAFRAADILADQLQDATAAMTLLGTLLVDTPDNPPIHEKLTDLAQASENWGHYCQILEAAYENASSLEELVALALRIGEVRFEQLAQIPDALEWYRRVLEDAPANATAIARMEAILMGDERYEELVELYETISLDVDPNQRASYLLKQGMIKEQHLDDLAGAVEAYREVLLSAPDNAAALNRLDGMLENPILGLAAVEILEPIYRQQKDPPKLARLLRIKAQEVEGSLDRAQLLTEAAELLASVDGGMADGFDTYLQAIRLKQFDAEGTLASAMQLAGELGRWQDLANTLEQVCVDDLSENLKLEALRHLAIVYGDKLNNAGLAELKLRELLQLDGNNHFALTMLARVLEIQGEKEELLAVLTKLGEQALDAKDKRRVFEQAASLATELEEFAAAARLYGQALHIAPDDAGLMENLAHLYRLTEDWEELVDILESRANLLAPDDAIASLLEATHVAATQMASPGRALALCRLVLERDTGNLDALKYTVDILREQGKAQEQMTALEKLATHLEGTELTGALFELQELALLSGDTESAASYVQRILDVDPANAEAQAAQLKLLRDGENLSSLVAKLEEQAQATDDVITKIEILFEVAGILADDIGDPATAIARLTQIQELEPNYLPARKKAAQLLVQQREFTAAIDAFEGLAGLVAGKEQAAALKTAAALALDEMSDPDRAIGLLERLRATQPDDQAALDLHVRSLEIQERWDELATLLRTAIGDAHDPETKAGLCKKLALVQRDGLGREDLFLNWLEEAHKAVEDPDVVDELLTHYRASNTPEKVASLLAWKVNFLTGRKQLRDVPALLLEAGQLELALGHAPKALSALRNAVELDGSFLPAIHALAMALFDNDELEEAFSHFQTLLLRINELADKQQKVLFYLRLATLYLAKDDKKRAKSYLTKLLSLEKDNSEALALLEQI